MQRMRRFAKYWDLVGNSGNFVETTPLIWSVPPASCRRNTAESDAVVEEGSAGKMPAAHSPFAAFLRWSDWLYAQIGRTDSIALARLAELLFKYLTTESHLEPKPVAETLWRDWQRGGRTEKPEFLRAHLPVTEEERSSKPRRSGLKRQVRHITGTL